ncbi:protein-lysine methyltransferase METTL21C-like isoform X2 [Sebastes umbrosus]|uniref:protein-lysine methyltransferase METTL21C-like isoform X2 n=1 Tax=Sebastes umbrosus TaxID=72105 RepID=UPI00189E31C4|nr:protein-lysine methyltransferase METTL21C-like isoform X2 [Sebastes umbrosus]
MALKIPSCPCDGDGCNQQDAITSESEVSRCSPIAPEILHWEIKQLQLHTGFHMDTLPPYFVGGTNYMTSGEEFVEKEEEEEEEEQEEEEEDGDKENKEEEKEPVNIEPADKPERTQAWVPSTFGCFGRDVYHYAGQDILIRESIDSYGAVMWPAALALCSFLDNNRQTVNLQGKEVLELGAGTGLVTIVASLLGASVTATDLPDVLGNLLANVMRNTRQRCRHTPKVAALSWGHDLERTFPTSVHRYDYVLAADVVYHHDFLEELLVTMKHFCIPGTTVIWANKVRFETDLTFTENFKKAFHTRLLAEDGEMKIFMATCRD